MYDIETRKRALALVRQGRSLNSVSKQTGISRAAIRSWQLRIGPLREVVTTCERCDEKPQPPKSPTDYAYLLGLYLGDGCISPTPRSGYYLRIACADAWPGLIEACVDAVRAAHPRGSAYRVRSKGYVSVTSYYTHWPCLFPQHGPGKKHDRLIALEPWQQEIVDEYPWELIRGLIHSDGCRVTNWTTRVVAGVTKRYEYPRYFFTNKSDDIRKILGDTLDRVGVEWSTLARGSDPFNISIARRPSVELMDQHIGPKY